MIFLITDGTVGKAAILGFSPDECNVPNLKKGCMQLDKMLKCMPVFVTTKVRITMKPGQGEMLDYDVVIIGGGPAGANCAYELAKQGKQVAIIEKDYFPRFKACAGMLTIKALHQLPYSIAPVVQWQTDTMTLSREFKAAKDLQASKTLVVTTVRSELDAFCLQQAQQAGAELLVCKKGFTEYSITGDIITVSLADGRQLTCQYLVGADGAHSKVRKLSGQFTPDRTAVALEGRVPLKRLAADTRKQLRFDFNVAKKGYGWLIPKADHINVGLYTRRPDEHPISKTQLQDYTQTLLGTRDIDDLLGFPVGTGGEYFKPEDSRVFLVGDAAGYAEPIFGEGIHNAIKSGRIAAQSILASQTDFPEYSEAQEVVRTDVWWCRQIAKAFYKFTLPALAILKHWPIRKVVMEGFADGLTMKECLKVLSPLHKSPQAYPVSRTMQTLAQTDKAET